MCDSLNILAFLLLSLRLSISKQRTNEATNLALLFYIPFYIFPLFFSSENLFELSRYIRRGKPDAGFALFESESLKWPGFVEFDDVNGKVLTYSAQDR